MAEIRLRINDESLIARIDDLAEQEGYSTRSKFIESILMRYVVFKDDIFVNELPPVVKAICLEAARNADKKIEFLIRSNINTMLKIQQTTDDLKALISNELQEK